MALWNSERRAMNQKNEGTNQKRRKPTEGGGADGRRRHGPSDTSLQGDSAA